LYAVDDGSARLPFRPVSTAKNIDIPASALVYSSTSCREKSDRSPVDSRKFEKGKEGFVGWNKLDKELRKEHDEDESRKGEKGENEHRK
jgi:hypothetical protein